jgi:trigger factor
MIRTEVKTLGAHEHAVHVRVPQEEFDRVYSIQVGKLSSQVRLPGFRPGKTPRHVIEKRFAEKLHEDTITELVQNHYTTAIEKSSLMPAIQPSLEVPGQQPESGFEFVLKVVTWPEVELKDVRKLSLTQTIIQVTDEDIRSVIKRLLDSKVRFEAEEGREAEMGDQLRIDFAGFVGDEPFEGGRGEDVELVLGEGRFIADFEKGLVGARPGEERTLSVQFPEDYHHQPLAGRHVRFEVLVKSVARPIKARDEADLASMLGFHDAVALREDIRSRLEEEAKLAAFETNREAVFDALIEAHELQLPEALIQKDMQNAIRRMVKSAHEKGHEPDPAIFRDEAFLAEVRKRSEKSLKLSVLVDALREKYGLQVSKEDETEEIDRLAEEYPEDQRERFRVWLREQTEQMDALRDRLLEKKCVEFILSQAKVKKVNMSLEEWQAQQNKDRESA